MTDREKTKAIALSKFQNDPGGKDSSFYVKAEVEELIAAHAAEQAAEVERLQDVIRTIQANVDPTATLREQRIDLWCSQALTQPNAAEEERDERTD